MVVEVAVAVAVAVGGGGVVVVVVVVPTRRISDGGLSRHLLTSNGVFP